MSDQHMRDSGNNYKEILMKSHGMPSFSQK